MWSILRLLVSVSALLLISEARRSKRTDVEFSTDAVSKCVHLLFFINRCRFRKSAGCEFKNRLLHLVISGI